MGKLNFGKQNMQMTNRYMDKEKAFSQFEKKTVTLDSINLTATNEKTFEYAIKGDQGPTVVLINGSGGPIEGWMKIWPLFDASMRVFAYNRLGLGKSSAPIEPQNAVNMVEDLRKLLMTLNLQPPYLLVGHSLGGFIAHIFASKYPQEALAVLFLESATVEDVKHNKKIVKGNPFTELNCVLESCEQILALPPFPGIPIKVIAGFHPISRMWLPKGRFFKRFEHQKKLLELSIQSNLIVATKSGHFPQMNEPKCVVEAIYNLIGR